MLWIFEQVPGPAKRLTRFHNFPALAGQFTLQVARAANSRDTSPYDQHINRFNRESGIGFNWHRGLHQTTRSISSV